MDIVNEVQMDGEPKIHVDRRPSIKLATTPDTVICMPIGDTHTSTVLHCPEDQGGCGQKWQAPGMRVPAVIPLELMLRHMNMVMPLNTTQSYLAEHGRLSAEARQIMTQKAKRLGAKYILYWDIDTIPVSPYALYIMRNWMERNPEAGAISGIYTTRMEPNEPLLYLEHGKGAGWDIPMGKGAEPVPIFGAGAGFLLARVDAVLAAEEMIGADVPIWADERTVPDTGQDGPSRRIMWGHDIRFCKLLSDAGWPVYAHGQVLCDHLDIETGVKYSVPPDAPGFQKQIKKNINTEDYWDAIYSHEGADSWRKYPKMYDKVVDEIGSGLSTGMDPVIVELGCGVGILGSKITAELGVRWTGYDISEVAVEMAKARFLDARMEDVDMLGVEHYKCDVLVATELMEHLDEAVFSHVINIWENSASRKFVFTVPDNCMGPEEVPEHTALFNEKLVRDRLSAWNDLSLRIEKADDHHLMVVLEK